ncbi:hypothetical protein SAMN04488121_101513 [Chitinophaga filiformis]|uniref:Uncharacterized protein n=1 Tax=Chitinophaga filiformis TaxID=104663 RepID=A0A1G7HL72_CHIFI|nr:hypothetical protein SAMN04488121_101513 [Chitinophaga filiformis]
MYKAKTILTTVAILALVGGVLALKINRISNFFYSNGTTLTTTVLGGPLVTMTYCTVPFATAYTTQPRPFVFSKTTCWHTTSILSTCPCTMVVYATL